MLKIPRIPRIPHLPWVLAGAGVLVVLLLAAGAFLYFSSTSAAPVQPIDFSHQVMVGAGVTCLYCHHDANRAPAAGMPSTELCMGCHKQIATTNDEVKKLAGYWERQQPIEWVRVYQEPRFVYFSHQVHVTAAQLPCEKCHGDVAHMDSARKVVDMNMGWCLDCHSKQPNAQQLRDCVVCHR